MVRNKVLSFCWRVLLVACCWSFAASGSYRECDIDTRGKSRGAKRIVFTPERRVYYTDDHYKTFKEVK